MEVIWIVFPEARCYKYCFRRFISFHYEYLRTNYHKALVSNIVISRQIPNKLNKNLILPFLIVSSYDCSNVPNYSYESK